MITLLTVGTLQASAQGVQYEWAKNMGSGDPSYAYGVTSDPLGNVYVTGYFNETGDFDPGANSLDFTSFGNSDIYVVKLNAAGDLVWAKQMGGTDNEQGLSVAVDAGGNVYTTGYFNGTVDFDPGSGVTNLTSVGGADIFISKLDSSGTFVWAKQIGGGGWDQATSIVLDDSANIYLSGYFQGTADFDPGANIEDLVSGGGFDIFVAKLSTAGDYIWAKNIGGGGYDFGQGIAVDPDGNVYTTGFFQGTADFDPGTNLVTMTSAGSYDGFVSKLDASGNYVWAKQIGGSGNDQCNAIAVDALGNVYTTGGFEGTADFDPGTATSSLISFGGYGDVFLSKLDSAGMYVWAKQMGGTDNDYGTAVKLDVSGTPVVSGVFNGTADFDPGSGTTNFISAGADDIFTCKISASGTLAWAKQLGGWSNDYGFSVSVDGSGNVYTAGMFNGVADFDPGEDSETLNSDAGGHIFVQKMICSDTSSSSLEVTACDSYILGEVTYTTSGVYTQKLPNAAGCDSTVTLDLTINNINPAVITINGFDLSTSAAYSSYQWLMDGNAISGATNSIYTVTANGNYQVAVTDSNGCMDTSDIYTVSNVGITDIAVIADQIHVFPNPAGNRVYIQSPVSVDIALMGLEGKIIQADKDVRSIDLSGLAFGVYFLRITDHRSGLVIKVEKIVKQR